MCVYPSMSPDYILYKLDYRLAMRLFFLGMHIEPEKYQSLFSAKDRVDTVDIENEEDLNWVE